MKITIKETKNCDTRALKPGQELDKNKVKEDTEKHIEAVRLCGLFFCDMIIKQFEKHDHTKLGEYLPAFTKALSSRTKGKEFKNQDWWKIHLTERHHLNDSVPEDVNMVDVLEMICDCVSAGMARTGEVYDITISNDVLQKAVKNTVDLLIDNIKVVKDDSASKKISFVEKRSTNK